MAKDRREDAGEFYPGGSVIPRGPVAPGGGGEPADYATVRTNAADGAAHAAKRGQGEVTDANPHGATASDIPAGPGVSVAEAISYAENAGTGARTMIERHENNISNPHATTAEQVGVRVVELVVEGDAKKIYLMLNGERTDERVTSYAALLAMAKRGLVRLYYNAVGSTGRKALYTAHMVDDNGTPAMRFDATGTLGEKVYTRSIALTKSGTDGIAVTIGELTEIAKSADVPTVTTTIAESSSGKAADAAAVKTALDNKATVIRRGDGAAYFIIDKDRTVYLVFNSVNQDMMIKLPYKGEGVDTLALASDIADATKLRAVEDPMLHQVVGYVTANGEYLNSMTANRITTLAEAATQVNAASVTELKDRDCSVVAYAEGMTITFAASDNLRSCEVLITGCTAETSLNVGDGDTVLRGDAEALTLEDGDNHLTFAEYAANKFFVTRHVANEIA